MNYYIENISKFNFLDEKNVIISLLENLKDIDFQEIKKDTCNSLIDLKKNKKNNLFENIINCFGIGTREGIGMMELAESLLRVPDKKTIYELLYDKISYKKNWAKYKNNENGMMINLMISCLEFSSFILKNKNKNLFHKFLSSLGLPFILSCSKIGVNKIGSEFIMGENIDIALKNSKKYKKYLLSYDILGEGARSFHQAEFYFSSYLNAIEKIAPNIDKSIHQRKRVSLSIKLSALHPKYEFLNYENLKKELIPKIKEIVLKASKAGINITIDAEECTRLPVSLMIFQEIFEDSELKDFTGLGLAVQAYNKSAMYVLEFLKDIANKNKKEIPVRLVKGAYWDSEIKKAQMYGLENFHLFTKKNHTDISYLACANFMIKQEYFYPQFATHNAYTISSIIYMSKQRKLEYKDFDFEFQRLQGMGIETHEFNMNKNSIDCRIYAPVGPYNELLAYLVRRILENGASTSFVHLLSLCIIDNKDSDKSFDLLTTSPVDVATQFGIDENIKISQPSKIYKNRLNSFGIDFGNIKHMSNFSLKFENFKNKQWFACPIISGVEYKDLDSEILRSPGDYSKISGKVINATIEHAEHAINELSSFFKKEWKFTNVQDRINIINKLADLLQENSVEITAILMLETGKTIKDCEGEIREAIDFCRYYSIQAEKIIGSVIKLDSHHLGEINELSMHPKGVFVCISPWNFPLAIFLGQIVAALLCGNTVAVKPAEQTPLVGAFAINLLFEAGLAKKAIAFLPGSGEIVGDSLIKNPLIAGIAFTGSTQTAKLIQKSTVSSNACIIPIIAETGGQNCMIMDTTILPEEAVDYVIESAFISTGQRCSALRVLYLPEEIHDKFLKLLSDATNSKKIGFAFEDLASDIGPVIDLEALKMLEDHIENMKDNIIYSYKMDQNIINKGYYFGPHIIKINHISELKKEIFGPILHIIKYRSDNFDEIIDQINSTGYGLTFGIQSRIESKFREVCNKIDAGNLYVNRSTIGAIVGVQPFGGMNLSGTGFKAGGPHYLYRFLNEKTYTENTASARGLAEVLGEK